MDDWKETENHNTNHTRPAPTHTTSGMGLAQEADTSNLEGIVSPEEDGHGVGEGEGVKEELNRKVDCIQEELESLSGLIYKKKGNTLELTQKLNYYLTQLSDIVDTVDQGNQEAPTDHSQSPPQKDRTKKAHHATVNAKSKNVSRRDQIFQTTPKKPKNHPRKSGDLQQLKDLLSLVSNDSLSDWGTPEAAHSGSELDLSEAKLPDFHYTSSDKTSIEESTPRAKKLDPGASPPLDAPDKEDQNSTTSEGKSKKKLFEKLKLPGFAMTIKSPRSSLAPPEKTPKAPSTLPAPLPKGTFSGHPPEGTPLSPHPMTTSPTATRQQHDPTDPKRSYRKPKKPSLELNQRDNKTPESPSKSPVLIHVHRRQSSPALEVPKKIDILMVHSRSSNDSSVKVTPSSKRGGEYENKRVESVRVETRRRSKGKRRSESISRGVVTDRKVHSESGGRKTSDVYRTVTKEGKIIRTRRKEKGEEEKRDKDPEKSKEKSSERSREKGEDKDKEKRERSRETEKSRDKEKGRDKDKSEKSREKEKSERDSEKSKDKEEKSRIKEKEKNGEKGKEKEKDEQKENEKDKDKVKKEKRHHRLTTSSRDRVHKHSENKKSAKTGEEDSRSPERNYGKSDDHERRKLRVNRMRSVQYSSADHTVTHHHTSRIYSESPKSNPVKKQSRQSQDAQAFENTFEYFKHVGNLSNQNPKRRSSKPIDCSESLVELEEVLFSYSVSEDTNKSGLARSKKMTIDGKRSSEMEDTHYCSFPFTSQNLALFCVFDGHAGKQCSTALTKIFPDTFSQIWKKMSKDGLLEPSLLKNFWNEVYQLVDYQLKRFDCEGSTATTLFIWRNIHGTKHLQCANVGDSSAFLQRGNRVISLTEEHKATSLKERKRLEEMGIVLETHQTRINGLGVSRAFGDWFPKENQTGIISEPYLSDLFELTAEDRRVILASDGLWDVMNGEKAFSLIESISDSTEASKKLIQTALSSSKCLDNITVIVINLQKL